MENRRILLVDDNEAIHADFRATLSPRRAPDALAAAEAELFGEAADGGAGSSSPANDPFTFQSAFQGEDALALVKQSIEDDEPFAMAFVDVRMPPGWDGIETIRHLWEVDPRLHVVVCTAFSDYSWEQMIDKLGRTDRLLILKKPFDPVEVRQLALTLTTKWNLARAAEAQREGLERAVAERTAKLEEATRKAEAASEAKSLFLASMSHEIRTPLNGVVGMIDLLNNTTELTERQRRFCHIAKSSASVLLSLINDILDFSKIEAGRLDLDPTDFTLHSVTDDIAEVFSHRAADRGIELLVSVHPEVPDYVHGDPGRVRQILTNLVSNAIKFTDKGEVAVRGRLESKTDTHAVVKFSVTDTGIGIPPERMDRLFQSFSQVDASHTRKYGGTGLGLAISKKLAELMGGQVGVESRTGKGSTFWFTVALELREPAARRAVPDMTGMRVLAVDDNATNLELIHEQLGGWKFKVDTQLDPARAVAQLKAALKDEPYRLAILDWHMPGMSGTDLVRAIRAEPELASLRLITLTSIQDKIEENTLRSLGVSCYLTKPIRSSALYDSIVDTMSKGGVAAAVDAAAPLPGARRRLKVLLAEDSMVNQTVATEILTCAGYTCEVANNGREALDRVRAGHYDVILMDCQMPEMDGFEATREIRKYEQSASPTGGRVPHVHVIALTANAVKGDRELCLAAGMDDYLTKPVDAKELLARLEAQAVSGRPAAHAGIQPAAAAAAAAVAPAADAAPIDARMLVERCVGKPEIASKVLDTFEKQIVTDLEKLKRSFADHDVETFTRVAHTVKGSAGMLSADRIRAVAAQLEQLGKDRTIDAAGEAIERLGEEVRQCLAYLPECKRAITDVGPAGKP
jgi:signal transduction histidine kinase/PleD family two-component response regulator/HPt (histidine-containing phosphotransfer) domain-containing protein